MTGKILNCCLSFLNMILVEKTVGFVALLLHSLYYNISRNMKAKIKLFFTLNSGGRESDENHDGRQSYCRAERAL